VVKSGVETSSVRGIGFDATCSLVARAVDNSPVAVGPEGDDRWDTILWMDHRAKSEAEEVAALIELAEAADVCSPEMQVPKAMWLKRRLPESWARIGHLFDLVDFLTWQASGSLARSHCALACKWLYRSDVPPSWRHDLLARLGLDDLLERGRLPESGVPAGTDLGPLTAAAAEELGLATACRVGAGLIDAYAGALGSFGGRASRGEAAGRAVLIAGTSNCLMLLTPKRWTIPGLWGPYFGAVLPDFWVVEGGQSAAGALLDHIVRAHAAGGPPTLQTHEAIQSRIVDLCAREGPDMAADIVVLPDFHGNRTPFAAPRARGTIVGMTLDESFDGLCRLYWRAAIGLALGIRQILDAIEKAGPTVKTMHLVGGHVANPLLCRLYADVTGRKIETSSAPDCTLLGAAMTGAAAAGLFKTPAEAALAMEHPSSGCYEPDATDPYRRDYRIFSALQTQVSALDEV